MINIYNETKTPYELTEAFDKICLSKRNSNGEEISIKISKSTIFTPETISECKQRLLKMVDMKGVDILRQERYSVIFGRTDFKPFLISTDVNKEIVFISLIMKDRKIVNVNDYKNFICDHYYVKDDELSLIICVNSITERFKIKLYNIATNLYETHEFYLDNGKLVSSVTISHPHGKVIVDDYRLKNFKPKKATYSIITKTENIPYLNKDNFRYSILRNVTEEKIDKILQFLLRSNVKAVTINKDGYKAREIAMIVDKCLDVMDIVYTIDANNTVNKIKC